MVAFLIFYGIYICAMLNHIIEKTAAVRKYIPIDSQTSPLEQILFAIFLVFSKRLTLAFFIKVVIFFS